MDQQQAAPNQITVFYSYAHADERLRKQLETHLSLLRQQGVILEWHDRQIVPGTDWAHEIDMHLTTARVILLLISSDFLASDYCYGVELRRALERHDAGEARVIPILLRPVADWDTAPFARLAVLPTTRKPITKWHHRDEAWADVVGEIRRAIEPLQATAGSSPPSSIHSTVGKQPESTVTALSSGQGVRPLFEPLVVSPSSPEQQDRARLLKALGRAYREALESSLQGVASIRLTMRERRDLRAAEETVSWQLPQKERLLPEGTTILDVYDEANTGLLILGNPGAGKSTLLYELAQALIKRAQHEEQHPLPVVLNLSLWAARQLPLERGAEVLSDLVR